MNRKFVCLVAASCLPFMFSLQGDFVFDDSEAITKNRDVSSENWTDLFYNDYWGRNIKSKYSHKSYRPLTTLSFRLNYYLNGKTFSAIQFKITNLLCHIVCTIIIWQTFHKLTKNMVPRKNSLLGADLGFTSALLCAVHPVHVEAISGIVGRADILAAITFFCSFLAYEKTVDTAELSYCHLTLTVILSTLSLLFKENGVTVLGFCIFYELVKKFDTIQFRRAKFKMKYLRANSVRRIAFLAVCTVFLLCVRWTVMGSPPEFQAVDNPAAFSDNFFARIATYNYIYFLNILLFLWPQWLCYDWSMGCIPVIESITDYRIIFIILLYVYAILGIKSVLNKRNKSTRRSIILASLLIIIPFLPAANIFFPVGFVIAERVLYIPSAGYCLLVSIGLHKMTSAYKIYKSVTALYATLILFYGLKSWQRSFDWQNEYQLFLSGLSVCPANAKVHYNIAKVVDDTIHDTHWALQEYKEAIRLHPQYCQAMNNLGNLLKKQKKYAEAEHYFKTALRLKKDFPVAWMNLGIVLCNVGRYEESRVAYETALKYRNNYPDCYFNLGNLYLEINNTMAAMENWLKAININSSHVLAWTNLLVLLDNTGQAKQALQIIPKALATIPNAPAVHYAIGNIYGKLKRYEEAEEHFIEAINLFDKRVEAVHYTNLGVLYHRWNKLDLAKKMYTAALKINPTFKSAIHNLKTLPVK